MRNKIKFLIVLLFIAAIPIVAFSSDCSQLSGNDKKECEDLEKKAQIYQDIIDLKNKQQNTLAAQMTSIDNEQAATKADLDKAQQEADTLSKQVESLERELADKNKEVDVQKKILSGLMQSYYEYDQQGLLGMVVLDEDMSSILNQSDYLEQSGIKVKALLSNLQQNRGVILRDYEELKQKKDDLDQKKTDLADKQEDLDATENQKQSLLAQTQGEEVKYQKLLDRVEKQKGELFNFSEASNLDEVKSSVSKYPSPKSNLASTSWYFRQDDSRWGNIKIGNSSSLMKDYGCAVTSVSMVFKEHGTSITPGKMAKQKIFYYDLIKWPVSWPPSIDLVSSISHGNVSWSKIDSEIKSGDPVIVYIRKTNGRGGHYVVVTGKDKKDYIVHDPYFGPNLYLSTSKSLVGKIGVDSKVTVDQMIIYN